MPPSRHASHIIITVRVFRTRHKKNNVIHVQIELSSVDYDRRETERRVTMHGFESRTQQ
jgi:hypothetical protein